METTFDTTLSNVGLKEYADSISAKLEDLKKRIETLEGSKQKPTKTKKKS